MDIDFTENILIEPIQSPILAAHHIHLNILRLDKIHPIISGNKWFKLKENFKRAISLEHSTILTFGGAYSNHLIATAAASKLFGLQSVGLVRGFHGKQIKTTTLLHCERLGMQLHFISREDYQKKDTEDFIAHLKNQFSNPYIIPEGGDNDDGIKGAQSIAAYIPKDSNLVSLAIGSGTTFCGIRNALPDHIAMMGFPVMKHGEYLHQKMGKNINAGLENWQLVTDYHFGGFAKHTQELIDFMNDFYNETNIPLDFVYNAKMMYGIFDLVRKNTIPPHTKILCIHTGGLQGNSAIQNQLQF